MGRKATNQADSARQRILQGLELAASCWPTRVGRACVTEADGWASPRKAHPDAPQMPEVLFPATGRCCPT